MAWKPTEQMLVRPMVKVEQLLVPTSWAEAVATLRPTTHVEGLFLQHACLHVLDGLLGISSGGCGISD
jgi:hypothetical protein